MDANTKTESTNVKTKNSELNYIIY
jgi:hypothetical protein